MVGGDQGGDAGNVFDGERHDRVVGASGGESAFSGRGGDAGGFVVVECLVQAGGDPLGEG